MIGFDRSQHEASLKPCMAPGFDSQVKLTRNKVRPPSSAALACSRLALIGRLTKQHRSFCRWTLREAEDLRQATQWDVALLPPASRRETCRRARANRTPESRRTKKARSPRGAGRASLSHAHVAEKKMAPTCNVRWQGCCLIRNQYRKEC